MEDQFHNKLRRKMDEFAHLVYKLTKNFPKDELYGIISQLRRSSLSVVLNYIEGYSRRKKMTMLNFFEISYGSLKEAKYLLNFSLKEGYSNGAEYKQALNLTEEIGAMLWKTIEGLKNK